MSTQLSGSNPDARTKCPTHTKRRFNSACPNQGTLVVRDDDEKRHTPILLLLPSSYAQVCALGVPHADSPKYSQVAILKLYLCIVMAAQENRYAKAALAVSIITLVIMAVGIYASWSTATQANSAANQAVGIASSAYSIANNYPPHIEVISTPLVLRPVNCEASLGENSSCSFRGVFNVSFTIIAPHVGTYDISIEAISSTGQFNPSPISYSPGCGGWSVKIGNVTISQCPPLRALTSLREGVPASEPFSRTVEVDVEGFTLTAPPDAKLNFSGQVTLAANITYLDVQTGKVVKIPFTVQVILLGA